MVYKDIPDDNFNYFERQQQQEERDRAARRREERQAELERLALENQ